MRGVIIWHCEKTGRAVVWCDDSGDLAYASDRADWISPLHRVGIGDYVGFDLRPVAVSRSCTNLRLLEKGHAPELAVTLRDASAASVIPVARSEKWPALVRVA